MTYEPDYEQIDANDPELQENIETAQQAFTTFIQVARMAGICPREEDAADILDELYAKDGDIYDPVAWNFAWQRVRNQRKETAQREAAFMAKDEAHQNELLDYKRPASHDLPALQAEMKSRQQQTQPRSLPDDLSHLSQEEFDNTPDEELRRRLGADIRVEDRQTRFTRLSAAETLSALILEGKTNRAGIRKVKSVKLSQEELTARDQRARQIADDKAERRKLEAEWRKK